MIMVCVTHHVGDVDQGSEPLSVTHQTKVLHQAAGHDGDIIHQVLSITQLGDLIRLSGPVHGARDGD